MDKLVTPTVVILDNEGLMYCYERGLNLTTTMDSELTRCCRTHVLNTGLRAAKFFMESRILTGR